MITFLLNQQEQVVEGICPNTTVLEYLREHRQLTGSKEGCASGDCGACTVVIASELNGKLHYQSINACITLLASLQGKQLITVEHLQRQQQLHPSQQALVDYHGSQCGFCTPGFVMSLFAYGKNHSDPDRDSIVSALGGNLCRCTGYRPIIDAAVQMYEPSHADQFDEQQQQTLAQLCAIAANSTVSLNTVDKQYFAPLDSDQLGALLLQYPAARLVAGATDLALEITQNLISITTLIDTAAVPQLKIIQQREQSLRIGAAVTYSEAEPAIIAAYPDLQELLERLGSKQIRNKGTLGGNIANGSPIADMPPVLIALGASLVLRLGEKSRLINIEDFYLGYKNTALQTSEYIEQIVIPKLVNADKLKVYKISKRLEDDISATCAAIKLQVNDTIITSASIAFGGMAAIPKRAAHCEQALLGKPWSEATIERAMTALALDFEPISDFRASADYRLQVSKNMLLRYFHEINAGSGEHVRVTHYA